jgi:pimeloyl-ACP methyl ester carboxylesterase
MEFKEKQYDGSYQVFEVEFHNEDQIFRGVLYLPPEPFEKPYSLVIFFHGFPQINPLEEIVKPYQFLLDNGYAFLAFNFRGYRFTEGKVSISSQVADSVKVIEFVDLMSQKNVFDLDNINIIAHDFGAYIAFILCSKIKIINRLLLLSPIVDLERHVNHIEFKRSLQYLNRFLPGYINGIENVDYFVEMTINELKNQEYQIRKMIAKLNCKKLKIIIGNKDKLTPIAEIKNFLQKEIEYLDLVVIENMSHDSLQEDYAEKVNEEMEKFFF